MFLPGGVLSRADDMMVIRGVNVFPSSIEQILRSFPEVIEYRMTARTSGEMDQLAGRDRRSTGRSPTAWPQELQLRLGLKVEVRIRAAGELAPGRRQRQTVCRRTMETKEPLADRKAGRAPRRPSCGPRFARAN